MEFHDEIFSLYKCPGVLGFEVHSKTCQRKYLGACNPESVHRGGVTYPPHDEVLMSLPVPTGD